jgi:hypothetical protein
VSAKSPLSKSMTLSAFDNGYWYATELRDFAEEIGVPGATKLRKDELERAIKVFLTTGKLESPTRRTLSRSGARDVDQGLSRRLPVRVYTNDEQTKDFLEREARRLVPSFRRKSGVRYRLNRWREEQLTRGVKLTYGDLVDAYVRLNQRPEPFERIPHGRYINFVADFLRSEKGATRARAIAAWKQLKAMDIPKDYRSWAKAYSTVKD